MTTNGDYISFGVKREELACNVRHPEVGWITCFLILEPFFFPLAILL